MALIQVRIDSKDKEVASKIYQDLGLDLSTAVRLFIHKSISENGLPFELKNQVKSKERK